MTIGHGWNDSDPLSSCDGVCQGYVGYKHTHTYIYIKGKRRRRRMCIWWWRAGYPRLGKGQRSVSSRLTGSLRRLDIR